jgi:hypothetical protein
MAIVKGCSPTWMGLPAVLVAVEIGVTVLVSYGNPSPQPGSGLIRKRHSTARAPARSWPGQGGSSVQAAQGAAGGPFVGIA